MSLAIGSGFSSSLLRGVSVTEQLKVFGNSTFLKDYRATGTLTADYSVGSGTATYTANRDDGSASTYVDASGVIRVTPATDDVPRFQGGYYDATGFHAGNRGLMVEGAGTNLVPKSHVIDDATWTETNTVASNADVGSSSPDGTATAPSLTASAANGTLILTTAVTAQTYSVWLKRKTGTGTVQISGDGTNFTTVTVTSSWGRFSDSRASASQKCGIKIVTDTDAVYVWGNQYEASPYATSFIPTTDADVTRNAEVLKYEIAGNRTAATETIAIKFAPESAFANDGVERWISATDTKVRRFRKATTATAPIVAPNANDSASCTSTPDAPFSGNTSYVVAASMQSGTSPYITVYKDGSSSGAPETTDDFTSPAWGTNFELGCDTDGINQLNGIIQSVAIFSDAKDATAVAAITAAMNQ